MRKLIIWALLALFCISSSGCSVVMAVRQPDKKNLKSLVVGTPRDNVLAEFGTPTATETNENGNKVDIFQFRQGYSSDTKAARALIHGAADFLTLGLWEVVGTPTEAVFSGKNMAVKVIYDADNKVKEIVYLKGKN